MQSSVQQTYGLRNKKIATYPFKGGSVYIKGTHYTVYGKDTGGAAVFSFKVGYSQRYSLKGYQALILRK